MSLIGHQGYDKNLHIRLIQEYKIPSDVAIRLVHAYGSRAVDVLQLANELKIPQTRLLPDFPILEAEIFYSLRYDWCMKAEDFLCRRTRIAFLHKDAAIRALPRVIEIMASELHWSAAEMQAQTENCLEYLQQFGGPKPMSSTATSLVRSATFSEIQEAFEKVDHDKKGLLTHAEIPLICELLQYPLSEEELDSLYSFAVKEYRNPMGYVSLSAFVAWWNSDHYNPALVKMKEEAMAKVEDVTGSGTMFG